MSPEQTARLAEIIAELEQAYMVKVAPPGAVLAGEPSRLSELIDQASAKLPGKYRPVVLKLERQIRAELMRHLNTALELGARVQEAGAGAPARWAYQSGIQNGLTLHFVSTPPPAAPPKPPARENR